MTPSPVSSYLVELRDACHDLMRGDPQQYPTLRDAWWALTEEDRAMTPDDHCWLADMDLGAAQAQKHAGRVAHARPSTRGFDPREPVPKRIARRIRALHPLCHYCGGLGGRIDHIWPLARGGANHITNYANACKRCNREKQDKTVPEWRKYRQSNGEAWPPKPYWTTEALDRLANHSPDGATMAQRILATLDATTPRVTRRQSPRRIDEVDSVGTTARPLKRAKAPAGQLLLDVFASEDRL